MPKTLKNLNKVNNFEIIKDYGVCELNGQKSHWVEFKCCECGKIKIAKTYNLNRVKSCGCIRVENTRKINKYRKAQQRPLGKNEYRVDGDIVYIKASNSDSECMVNKVLYDELLKYYTWRIKDTGYFVTTINKKEVLMHRFIFNKDINNLVIHHKDINKLNNTVENLQIMTDTEHMKLHNKLKKKK